MTADSSCKSKSLRDPIALLPIVCLFIASVAHAQSPRVGFDGYGPARIGMTRAALQHALDVRLIEQSPEADSDACLYVYAEGAGEGVGYMLIDGRLARIDVDTADVTTISGAHVGSTEAEVRALYPGQVKTTPHFYTGPEGHYLVLTAPDGQRGIRFETDGQRVVRWYAGTEEAIQLVEGCQ
jgi:hypothetical protein